MREAGKAGVDQGASIVLWRNGLSILLVGLWLVSPARSQESADDLYKQGVAARIAGRHGSAVDILNQVLAREPANVDARLQLGLALVARRRYDAARREFNRVLEAAPDYDDARLGLARVAFFRGDLAEARRELDTLRRRSPDNAEAKAIEAQVARAAAAGKVRRPIASDQAERTAEQQAEAGKAGEAAKATRDARARAAAEAAAKARAAEAQERRIRQGRLLRRAGRFAEAERLFRSALDATPRNGDVFVDLGLALAFQNRFDEARKAFEQALRLAPGSPDAILGLARIDLYTNSLDSAKNRVDGVLAKLPTSADALSLKARIRLAQGDAEGAEADFRRLVATNPRELDYQLGLGDSLRAQLRDQEARIAYEAGLAIAPASIDAQTRLAQKARPRWRLDLDGGFSRLTQGLDSWREGRIGLGYVLNARTYVSGGVEVTRRFGLTDVLIDTRVDHRPMDGVTTYIRVGGTPQSDYRPEFLINAGSTYRLADRAGAVGPTLATLDAGFARYAAGDVKTVSPGLQQYFLDGRVWLTARLIGTESETGELLGGYVVRSDWLATERLSFFVGYSDAPENSDGRTLETKSVFGGLGIALDDTTTLRLSLARETRRASYDRDSLNLGIATRF